MVMDGYYIQDQLPDLWRKVNTLHLSYLEMEESPKKLELKNKLDECIKEYLCIAPHGQKFCFKETAEVLHRSASSRKDFSGYRAALGWNAIGMYAGNLISQPWRQEYREIKMFSGFYKHQIEAHLVGAEIMFEAMGYKHAGNGIMVLEGPICPDRVTNVSQDSLVAYVECQIMKEIWEEVSTSFKITWLEVLEFRESHLCGPRKCVEALRYQIQQHQYHEHQRNHPQGNNDYLPSNSRQSVPHTHGNNDYLPNNSRHSLAHMHITSPSLPANHSFPPLAGHSHMPMPVAPMLPSPACIYNNGYYGNNYGTYGMMAAHYNCIPPAAYSQAILKQPYNGYYYNGYAPPVPPFVCPVPTGQLIELDSHNQAYDVPDGLSNRRRPSYTSGEHKVEPKKGPARPTDKEDYPGQYDSWDYVYRDLESQGYSKDLGERGDVLNTQHGSAHRENRVIKDLDAMKITDRPLKINEALEKCKQHDRATKVEPVQTERKNSNGTLSSSYDNLSGNEVNLRKPARSIISSKNRVAPDKEDVEPKAKFTSKTLDLKKLKVSSKSKTTERPKTMEKIKDALVEPLRKIDNSAPGGKWQCSACTYLNDSTKNICEMCSKSKAIVSQQMEIGGSECSQCTLVNPKEKKVCEACGASLQNSPTYI